MAQALRATTFHDAIGAALDGMVKGQTQVFVRTESEEAVVAEVLVIDGNIVLFTKEALADLAPKAKKVTKQKEAVPV